ncbi:methionine ABC transporter permease [Cellulomonas shaoxiangyii]|uniref:ABC transporter permease n=1 Tax=Cellulomonas shaoxiangyii TaxID=2566013 RepID=A0A4P7SE74_9CELL|nr:methionine ABC transporter permease [Cellulomonas shaoxiangyii]QCB92429.1 ABC transporter permease [Cellulomonas shaoxiangyii]TGY85632.1 ABC transporter permease [Cellulomonas shaoxiangyii]
MGELWAELTSNRVIAGMLPTATAETLQMVGLSALVTLVVGLPLGLLLRSVAPDGLTPNRPVSAVLGVVVNVLRALPFIILAVALIPLTRALVGTSLGWEAAVVPLSIGTIPFFARLVETAVRDVAAGKVEAARVMGSTTATVVSQVLVREALPSIVSAFTVTVISLIGFSAMVGAIGAGGLGFLAISYGFQRFDPVVLYTSVVVIVVLVTVVQVAGDALARRLDHR